MKKMSSKEFWQVLEEKGRMYRKNWEYEGILNMMCLAFRYQANDCNSENLKKDFENRANAIFDYLWDKGYYKN